MVEGALGEVEELEEKGKGSLEPIIIACGLQEVKEQVKNTKMELPINSKDQFF